MSKSNTPFGYIKSSINQPVSILKYAIGVVAIAALVAFIFNTTQGSDKKNVENTFLLEDIRKTNEEHLKTIADLQRQLDKTNEEAAKVKEELIQKQSQIDAKGVQIDAKEGSIGTLQTQLSDLKNDKMRLHQIIDERGRELAQMTERNKEQNSLLETTQNNLQKTQDQTRQDQQAIKNLQEELRGLNEKVNIAYNHEKDLQSQVNKLLTDLNQTRTELNQSRMDLSDAKAELRILKELHPMNNNMPVQQITVSQPQEESSANALKMVAIVSVIVMFIVFVVYMLRD
ncbi:hypothetical protein WAF17_19385 [Bernardetia sp. ABR2-2B]|uniref:hypothetical protein n=1 Tax=Bernardetia sp. ABR2-2B TaxID=3127472 RepID=UPI0030CC62D9